MSQATGGAESSEDARESILIGAQGVRLGIRFQALETDVGDACEAVLDALANDALNSPLVSDLHRVLGLWLRAHHQAVRDEIRWMRNRANHRKALGGASMSDTFRSHSDKVKQAEEMEPVADVTPLKAQLKEAVEGLLVALIDPTDTPGVRRWSTVLAMTAISSVGGAHERYQLAKTLESIYAADAGRDHDSNAADGGVCGKDGRALD